MDALSTTHYGRLLSVGILIALTGGGLGSLDKGATGVAIVCLSLIVGLALAIVAIAFAIRSNVPFAVGGVIALPYLFFLFVVGLAVAWHDRVTWAAYVFAGIGAAFGLNALLGSLSLWPSLRAHHDHEPAHAH